MSRTDLLSSLVGPIVSVSWSSSLGGAFARYEQDFATYNDSHWAADGTDWASANYYDRAFINYVWYARTGEEVYLERGNAIAADYLNNYVEANNYGVASWWSMPKGIAAHYLLNGDQASLSAIGKMADQVVNPWNTENNWTNLFDPHQSEGREQARALETLTQAILIDAPSVGVPNIQPNGEDWGVSGGNDFRALAKSLVEKILSSGFQRADGSRPHFVDGAAPDGAPIDKPFMNGLMNEALMNYYEQVEADPRIVSFIKANLDYMWANEWDATAKAFQYIDETSATGEEDVPAADLNMLIVNGFGFVYKHTGDATYLERGNLVFEGGVEGNWLEGSKQFNQQYASSYNYIAYTQADPDTSLAIGRTIMGSAIADMLVGGGGDDTISGMGAADKLYGQDGNDQLLGGAGADRLSGGAGNDRLDGGAGNDVLEGSAGADRLIGGDGLDYASYASAAKAVIADLANAGANRGDAFGDVFSGVENLIGGNFADTLGGDARNNVLSGRDGNDQLLGRAGADRLSGGAGNDRLDGGAGNDVLEGSAGADRLIGGDGLDYASYASAAKAVIADLANAGANRGDAFGDTFSGVENLIGGNFADTLGGDARNNVLSGRDGNDQLLGRAGADRLSGGAGNDRLDGGAGKDVLEGSAGADRLIGGDGLDYASYASAAKSVIADLANAGANRGDAFGDVFSGVENLIGGNFADTLGGDARNNVLSGRDGNDQLLGRAGADRLSGGAGNDRLDGGAGNDVLEGSAGADRLIGGDGLDYASYASAAKSVIADLANAGANRGDAFGDVFSGVENLIGGNFADTLGGDARNNVLLGRDGNDQLLGRAGADRLSGGAGNDRLDGGAGNDVLEGSAGADRLIGGDGLDYASYASAAKSVIADLANAGANRGDAFGDVFSGVENLIGGNFADTLGGDTRNNVLSGRDGNDQLLGGAGADRLSGGAGNDRLDGGAGNDVLEGSAGADRLIGGDGLDYASYASAAKAVIADLANAGANRGDAFGDVFSGVENLIGGNFADTLGGDARNNVLSGRDGNDQLLGRAGADRLSGGAGNDRLDGGAGNDVLEGSAGADRLIGGDGLDYASYASAAKAVIADLANAGANRGDAFGDTFSGVENLIGGNFADTLGGDARNNVLSGRDGNDQLLGRAGADRLSGGAGNDRLDGGAGNDVLEGSAGADRLIGGDGLDYASYASAAKSVIADLANAGANRGDAFGDVFSGVENLIGGNFADTLGGDARNNVLLGRDGNDQLLGRAGADRLSGGAGNDRLDGGAGNDVLEGGEGADVLIGGYGEDTFQFRSTGDTAPGSRDIISDFVRGVDRIDLRLIDANVNMSGDQAFSFIGDRNFSGKAGEMHFVNHVLSGDVNGDSIADFAIDIRGTAPSSSDVFF